MGPGPAGPEAKPSPTPSPAVDMSPPPDISHIRELLRSKDDTSRFVALALLKSVLDNSPGLRNDEASLVRLWEAVPQKFLDRLMRTAGADPAPTTPGRRPAEDAAANMLDLAVSVLRVFTALLPPHVRRQEKMLGRMPLLVGSLPHSSAQSQDGILQLLLGLVTCSEGATEFVKMQDLSALVDLAPAHATVLGILHHAWINAMMAENKGLVLAQVDEVIPALVSAFQHSDAVTLLDFLGKFLQDADPVILPRAPEWLDPTIGLIERLITKRPNPDARSAYTTATASLLQAYPEAASRRLFSYSSASDDKPFAYLLISLLMIDIRSAAPTLLQNLNGPAYPASAARLASAFDVISGFVGYLVRCLDSDSVSLPLPPDLILKLRKSMSETMSLTMEFLRDRWDASIAGAMGLHPDARVSEAHTIRGSRKTLSWEIVEGGGVRDDMLILAALRALAIWLREDDNELLRLEASGLMDMFVDLYSSSGKQRLDFRPAVLVALESVTATDNGLGDFLKHNVWQVLSSDLLDILRASSRAGGGGRSRVFHGTEIVRVLLPVVEADASGSTIPDEWMALVGAVAACDLTKKRGDYPLHTREFHVAVLQLVCALMVKAARPKFQKEHLGSVAAIRSIAEAVGAGLGVDEEPPIAEGIREVFATLDDLSRTSTR